MSRQIGNYEHVLMCLICRSLFDDHDHQPKFLSCHHTFCKECLREYVRQMGDDIECPSCRKVTTVPAAGVAALQTNFYAKYIQTLVYGGGGLCGAGGGPGGGEGAEKPRECEKHGEGNSLIYYCRDCVSSACRECVSGDGECAKHKYVALAAATEQFHQNIDSSFSDANALIERKKVELESLLKMLSVEKDQALLKIESTFEAHVHVLSRRATMLKNNVIDVYNEHVASLESDLEEISTAMTCIVSLKEYHEAMIGRGDFTDTDKGISEIDEVRTNIEDRIQPSENHIVFFEKHGVDKYRACAADLGRVICNRTGSQRPVSAISATGSSQPTSPDESSYSQSASPRPSSAIPRPTQKQCDDLSSRATNDLTSRAANDFTSRATNDLPNRVGDVKNNLNTSVDVTDSGGGEPSSSSCTVANSDASKGNFTVKMRRMAAEASGQYARSACKDQLCNGSEGDGPRPGGVLDDPRLKRQSMGMSYDEQRLRKELGVVGWVETSGRGDCSTVDPRRLSRSEFWATLSAECRGGTATAEDTADDIFNS